MKPYYDQGGITIYHGDCIEVMRGMEADSIDAIVTDPPYGLEFMGKEWDAPWRREDGIGSAGGFGAVEMRDGAPRLARPSFTGSMNPTCRNCGGLRRGTEAKKGQPPCRCNAQDFPNLAAVRGRAFAAWCESWAAALLRVAKPGAHLLAFGGTRTYHRMACAIEDAGFEIRDSIHWTYGSGFPKSLDVSKAIDRAAGATREVVDSYERKGRSGGILGAEVDIVRDITAPATDAARQWDGWGTALKPSHEPIVVARKPLTGTVAGNVLAHGTGAINIDGCRVGTTVETWPKSRSYPFGGDVTYGSTNAPTEATGDAPAGRWPANTILTHAPDCDPDGGCGAGCPCAEMDAQSGVSTSVGVAAFKPRSVYNADAEGYDISGTEIGYGDTGGASRFFPAFYYTAKASSAERPRGDGVAHPTVKPLDLMRWLVRLVTPPGGLVLDPFLGSGTTAIACHEEGLRCVGIEREPEYVEIARARVRAAQAQGVLPFGCGE